MRTGEFEDKLENIKNLIYKNIYNNLIYIYKSKGTMKALRNLIHCYGVDTDLIRINAYGDNVNYIFEDNFRPKAERKKYADFNDPDRFQATVYQQTASGNPDSRTFIAAQGNNTDFTAECEVIFPRKLKKPDADWFPTPFLSASIFGWHTALPGGTDFTWATPDHDLEIYAVRDELESNNAYFQLTNVAGTINLTSSLFPDIYENKKWNLAVRLGRNKYGIDLVTGSSSPGDYLLEFYGVNSEVDVIANEFYLTETLLSTPTTGAMGRKRLYLGSHYLNFTGSLLEKTDLKISSLRFWGMHLDNDVIKAHARDGGNYGTLNPSKNTYLYPMGPPGDPATENMPQVEFLGLNWNFNNVTSSGDGATLNAYDAGYEVQDLSSGSLELASDTQRFPGSFANALKRQHTGRGDFYLANDPKVMDLRYVYSGKQNAPEVVYSSDMIQIMSQDDIVFTRESRPIDYYFQIEKSMYQTISDEMLNVFATIVDFNNLIGEPVNRYRPNYKKMGKLRQLFFENVQNTPSLDKYIKFYEWLDASLNIMLQQLLPASANFSDDIRNMVESHVLERNKYKTKFPTLEFVSPEPSFGINGINELLYNWKYGHAPSSSAGAPSPQSENCFWWKERADRTTPLLSSSVAGVNFDKNQILSSSVRVLNRSFSTPVRFSIDKSRQIQGGYNRPKDQKRDFVRSAISFGTGDGLELFDLPGNSNDTIKDCTDDAALRTDIPYYGNGIRTIPASDYTTNKMSLFAPFAMTKEVANTQATVVNYHEDTYGDDYEVPAQSPFTNYAVGGHQYRHVALNDGTDNTSNRMEGFQITPVSGTDDTLISHPAVHDPRGVYYRDEVAKRPVNIRNIHHTTGSTILGNYNQIYDVIQTCGRYENNRAFVKAGGFDLEPNYIYSTYVLDIAAIQYDKIQRGRTPWVFINRFSSPGGPDTAGDSNGGPGLDRYSAEYSSNNSLNYRNNFVRGILQKFYTSHVGQFGYYTNTQNINGLPGSAVNAFDYSGTGSLYQVNRNPIRVLSEGKKREFQNISAAHFSSSANEFMSLEVNDLTGVPTFYNGHGDDSDKWSVSGWAYLSSSITGSGAVGIFSAGDPFGLASETKQGMALTYNDLIANKWNLFEGWTDTLIITNWAATSSMPLDQWFNFAVSHDASTPDGGSLPVLYINGAPEIMTEINPGPGNFKRPQGTSPFILGHSLFLGVINTWEGKLDEIAYWKTDLSQKDIDEIFGNGCIMDLDQVAAAGSLVSWWRMGDKLIFGAQDTDGANGIWHDSKYKNDLTGESSPAGTGPAFVADTPPSNGCNVLQGAIGCKRVYDNYYVQHPIPRTDCQYSWVSDSTLGYEILADDARSGAPYHGYFGCVCPTQYWPYKGYDFLANGLGEIVDQFPATFFVSASDFGSWLSPSLGGVTLWGTSDKNSDEFMFTDFVGINYNFYDPITASVGYRGYPLNVAVASIHPTQYLNLSIIDFIDTINESRAMGLNGLILHRQGPYGWPPFKQIRGGDNPLVRYYRNNNLVACNRTPGKIRLRPARHTLPITGSGIFRPSTFKITNAATITDRFGPLKVYKEPCVTSNCFPLLHTLGMKTTVMDVATPYSTVEPVTLQTTLENNLELFTTRELIVNSNNDPKCDDQAYDTIKGLYLKGALNEPSNPVYSFVEMVYKERVYPTTNNAHSKISRERLGYKNDFWEETRSARTILGASKWGGSS